MTPALILAMMILGWISVALAMLWGMLRIARRHHPPRPVQPSIRRHAHAGSHRVSAHLGA
ncbi:hypothetical protein CXK94_10140 [Stutzerimonas stutzeri]|uniref:Uncharacterized protein n=1 Tax=Stutzerimonas stutzeri TaxID=316 RepID=A0A2N8T5C5_STUST|nr:MULTISPECIES: hypothetical protein [Pseudomonadaceae]MCQ4325209.1 hypothetical protein [Stutzerimonas stutzeri]PNG09967.1 hypothetical protein CXK94_10140 [Stutzerimonas stutzeri]